MLRYTGNGKGIASVLHPEHAAADVDKEDAAMVTYAANWHFYSYDFASNEAPPEPEKLFTISGLVHARRQDSLN